MDIETILSGIFEEFKRLNNNLEKLIALLDEMKILRETLESWAKGKKVDFGGAKDT